MENLLSTTITVESIEDKGKSIKLKGSDKKSYSFWKTKQDGQNTSMYEQFKNMGIEAGTTVNISYKVEEFTLPDGKQAHANKVIWFREAGGSPVIEKPRQEAVNAPSGHTNDQFGFRLAIHGMVNGLLASGLFPKNVIELLPDLWLLEKAIEEKLSKPAGHTEMTIAETKIEQNKKEIEEIGESIPF